MLKGKIFLLIICFAALCLSAAPAFADFYGTVDVSYKALIRGSSTLSIHTPYSGGVGTFYDEVDVGLHLLDLEALNTVYPGVDSSLPSNSYLVEGLVRAFCIDLRYAIPGKEETYLAKSLDLLPGVSSGGPMTVSDAKYVAQLLNTNTYETASKAAALQVAIWEVIYDTTWDTTADNGNFYLNTGLDANDEVAIATAANDMLSGLSQASSFSQYTGLSRDTGKAAQDFVLVPVPAAVILGILGLGVAGWKLRRFA